MNPEIELVIFDMDELMIACVPYHTKIFETILQKYGASLKDPKKPLMPAERASQFGKKIKDILAYLKQKYEVEADLDTLDAEFNKHLLPDLADNFITMPGLIPLINSLTVSGYPLAIASSSTRPKIDIVLDKLQIAGKFTTIVSGEEVEHGKPAPDIFLKASSLAGTEPARSLVLEDATNGVLAAKAAGMHVIGVHNKLIFESLGVRQDLSKADLQVESLEEITPAVIKSLSIRQKPPESLYS